MANTCTEMRVPKQQQSASSPVGNLNGNFVPRNFKEHFVYRPFEAKGRSCSHDRMCCKKHSPICHECSGLSCQKMRRLEDRFIKQNGGRKCLIYFKKETLSTVFRVVEEKQERKMFFTSPSLDKFYAQFHFSGKKDGWDSDDDEESDDEVDPQVDPWDLEGLEPSPYEKMDEPSAYSNYGPCPPVPNPEEIISLGYKFREPLCLSCWEPEKYIDHTNSGTLICAGVGEGSPCPHPFRDWCWKGHVPVCHKCFPMNCLQVRMFEQDMRSSAPCCSSVFWYRSPRNQIGVYLETPNCGFIKRIISLQPDNGWVFITSIHTIPPEQTLEEVQMKIDRILRRKKIEMQCGELPKQLSLVALQNSGDDPIEDEEDIGEVECQAGDREPLREATIEDIQRISKSRRFDRYNPPTRCWIVSTVKQLKSVWNGEGKLDPKYLLIGEALREYMLIIETPNAERVFRQFPKMNKYHVQKGGVELDFHQRTTVNGLKELVAQAELGEVVSQAGAADALISMLHREQKDQEIQLQRSNSPDLTLKSAKNSADWLSEKSREARDELESVRGTRCWERLDTKIFFGVSHWFLEKLKENRQRILAATVSKLSIDVLGFDIMEHGANVSLLVTGADLIATVWSLYDLFCNAEMHLASKLVILWNTLVALGVLKSRPGAATAAAILGAVGSLFVRKKPVVETQDGSVTFLASLAETLGSSKKNAGYFDHILEGAKKISAVGVVMKGLKFIIDHILTALTGKDANTRFELDMRMLAHQYVKNAQLAYDAMKGTRWMSAGGDFSRQLDRDSHTVEGMIVNNKLGKCSEETREIFHRIKCAQSILKHMIITNPLQLVGEAGEGLIVGLFGKSGVGKSSVTSYLGFCVNEANKRATTSLNDCVFAYNATQPFVEGHNNQHLTVVIDEFGQYTDKEINTTMCGSLFSLDNSVKSAMNSAAVDEKGKHFALQQLTILTSNIGSDNPDTGFILPPYVTSVIGAPEALYRRIDGFRMMAKVDEERNRIRTGPINVLFNLTVMILGLRANDVTYPIDPTPWGSRLAEAKERGEDALEECAMDILMSVIHAHRDLIGSHVIQMIEEEYDRCWFFSPLTFVNNGTAGQEFVPTTELLSFRQFKELVLQRVAQKQKSRTSDLFKVASAASKNAVEKADDAVCDLLAQLHRDIEGLEGSKMSLAERILEYGKENSLISKGLIAMCAGGLAFLGWKGLKKLISKQVDSQSASGSVGQSRSTRSNPKANNLAQLGRHLGAKQRLVETQAGSLKVECLRFSFVPRCAHEGCKPTYVYGMRLDDLFFLCPSHLLNGMCKSLCPCSLVLERENHRVVYDFGSSNDFINECAFIMDGWMDKGNLLRLPCDAVVIDLNHLRPKEGRWDGKLPQAHLRNFRTSEENMNHTPEALCQAVHDDFSTELVQTSVRGRYLLTCPMTTFSKGHLYRGQHRVITWVTDLSQKGLCGSPYIVRDRIIGLHSAGVVGEQQGFASCLDRELLQQAIDALKGQELEEFCATTQAGAHSLVDEALERLQVPVFEHSLRVVQPNKSAFVQQDCVSRASLGETQLFTNQEPRGLSVLRPVKRRRGEEEIWVSPLANGLGEFYSPEHRIEVQDADVSDQAEEVVDALCTFTPSGLAGWELEETIAGSDRNPSGLNQNSSVGLDQDKLLTTNPKSKDRAQKHVTPEIRGKRRFLEYANGQVTWYGGFDSNPVVLTLAELFHWASTGRTQDKAVMALLTETHSEADVRYLKSWLYALCCKDERRSQEKIEKVSTRLFMVSPVAGTIATTMVFGPMMTSLQKNASHNIMQVGINPHSKQWGELAEYLKLEEWKILAGDYSKFDKRIPKKILRRALNLLKKWRLRGVSPEEQSKYDAYLDLLSARFKIDTPTAKQLVDMICDKIATGVYCVDDVFFILDTTNPSGNKITVELNCAINCLLICEYILHVAPEIIERGELRIATYGDDHIFTVPSHYAQVTMKGFAAFLWDKYRIVYTDPQKNTDVPLEIRLQDLTYLKRKFVKRDGWWFAPLDLVSIENMLYWRRANMSPEVAIRINYRAMAIELVHHGREIFEQARVEAMFISQIPGFPEWEEALKDFHSSEALLTSYGRNSEMRDYIDGEAVIGEGDLVH